MRVLDLTSDCLLHADIPPQCEVVHCQTGPAVMHSGCLRKPPAWKLLSVFRELLRGRRYDWVVLPPVHLDWTVSNQPLRRFLKIACAILLDHPRAAQLIKRIFFGSKAHFIVTDYSDMFQPSEFAIRCMSPRHYFMLNVPRDLVARRIGPADTLIHYLPTVIQDELIDDLISRHRKDKEYDIFIAGYYHNPQREKQLEAAEILRKRGVNVFELKEKSFEKFTAAILNSKLCFAARGLAYHCFRPLEAAAANCAPIYHESENGTYHDYVDQKNCFLYDPQMSALQIADYVELNLGNRQKIADVAEGAIKLLNEKHRASALARQLWAILSPTKM